MISSIISRVVILVFGTLYPAYASYKAVKTKNVKEYVKWMMYWIVFALFTCTETFTDIFLSWFPFYYEIKIILVIWLLSPATKGSSILYRKFVHPMLSSREQEIDDYISKAKEQSYRQVLDLGQKGVTVLMQTAIKSGGGIVNQLKKSYSLSDLSDPTNDGCDETDDVLVTDPRLVRRRKPGRSPHRSSSASSASVYFSEVDVVATGVVGHDRVTEVRSVEDISSGYSSGEGLYAGHQPLKLQSRDSIATQRANSLTRSRSTRVTRSSVPKKSSVASDDSDENEVFDTNIIFLNDKAKKIDKLPEKHESSSSEAEFFDIPDNNGFQLHGKTLDSSERSNSNSKDSDSNKIISSKLEVVKYNPKDCPAGANPSFPAMLGYDSNSKITACKNDISSSSLSFNLTKLSSALSSLYPSFASSNQKAECQRGNLDPTSKQTENIQDSLNLESNYRKPEISKALANLNPQSESSERIENIKSIESDLTKKISNLRSEFLASPASGQTLVASSTSQAFKSDTRGGKYNKRHAPLPPLPPKRNNLTANPIKATLVLQPGVVRSLSSSAESLNKEIFLNYSPKVRRRSRHQSPSSKSSDSSSSQKSDNALTKMLRLPKKMASLNIPGKVKEKRNSWGEFFHSKKLVHNKVQSKSASNLHTIIESNEKEQQVAKPIRRSSSQISIKNMSDSPLAHRRLKVIRRYVDNDID